MDEARKASLLAYCKLTELADDPEVEKLIPVLYDAAVGYMTNAGVAPPEAGGPSLGLRPNDRSGSASAARAAQYDLCINYLVLDAWERRETSVVATVVADNPAFRRMMNQMKLTEGCVYGETGESR